MANLEFEDEVEAINSIYGDGTLLLDSDDIYILNLPNRTGSFRMNFPADYPNVPPAILGTQSSGDHKGDASRLLEIFRDTVGRLFVPGEVCLFTVIEDIGSSEAHSELDAQVSEPLEETAGELKSTEHSDTSAIGPEPPWVLSDVITEKKSVFIARVAQVSSVQEAEGYLRHLLVTDKKVAKATHSITAWRIKGENDVTFQDCDDDGETAAGGKVFWAMFNYQELRWYRASFTFDAIDGFVERDGSGNEMVVSQLKSPNPDHLRQCN